jgi:hypothetical protein
MKERSVSSPDERDRQDLDGIASTAKELNEVARGLLATTPIVGDEVLSSDPSSPGSPRGVSVLH